MLRRCPRLQNLTVYSLDKLISETRRLAAEYKRSTGQSLPVSGEIARHDAARILDLTLCEPRTGGVDAIGKGKREVRVGYIRETPIWKTSYRLVLGEKDEALRIYAMLEKLRRELNPVRSGGDERGPLESLGGLFKSED